MARNGFAYIARLIMLKKETDKSSSGCECLYFSNGDGTGWKVYQNREAAELARATQIWADRYNIAPQILSKVQECEIELKAKTYFRCPASGLFFDENGDGFTIIKDGKKLTANCSDFLFANRTIKTQYCFLTEEAEGMPGDYEGEEALSYIRKTLDEINDEKSFDLHENNAGIIDGEPVMIDFGKHFRMCLPPTYLNEAKEIAYRKD